MLHDQNCKSSLFFLAQGWQLYEHIYMYKISGISISAFLKKKNLHDITK